MAESIGQGVLVEVDLHIRQGSDCAFSLVYSEEGEHGPTDQDYSGWSARSQIRQRVGGDVWLELTNHLTYTVSESSLTVSALIPAAVTEDPAWNTRVSRVVDGERQPSGVWDIELVSGSGAVIPLAAGRVFVDPDVTRED